MELLYPHNPNVARVHPFPAGEHPGSALAAVTMNYGPVTIRAKLIRSEEGRLFLSMPSRKSEATNQWFEHVFFQDRSLHNVFEQLAIDLYERKTQGLPLSA